MSTVAELLKEREDLQRNLDGMMLRLYSLYDVAKALPAPYKGMEEMANSLLHDFAATAHRINHYVTAVTGVEPPEGI